MASTRIILTPRWSGDADSDFYPWLRSELAEQVPSAEVQSVALQSQDVPDVDRTTAAVEKLLIEDHAATRTIAVGHSVGCQAVLRALASGRLTGAVDATLLVAGWWNVDEPWPDIQPWIDRPFDLQQARDKAGRLVVLLSDDDPFTSDMKGSARQFSERLGAEIRLVPGAQHFNAPQAPAVLRALLDMLP